MPALMAAHGFELDLSSAAINSPGGTSREAVPWHYLGHHPHHPFRPADSARDGSELQGDPPGPYVTITHAAQVGRADAHGAPDKSQPRCVERAPERLQVALQNLERQRARGAYSSDDQPGAQQRRPFAVGRDAVDARREHEHGPHPQVRVPVEHGAEEQR